MSLTTGRLPPPDQWDGGRADELRGSRACLCLLSLPGGLVVRVSALSASVDGRAAVSGPGPGAVCHAKESQLFIFYLTKAGLHREYI